MSLVKNTIKNLTYRGHTLIINEIPNKIYKGITTIDSKEWTRESSLVEYVIDWFKSKINNLYKNMTYEDLIKAWGSNYKKVVYKNHILWITAIKRKDNKVFYIGVFYYYLEPARQFHSRVTSFENIHYDKVISKFERFVDEHCIDWQAKASFLYKGYEIRVNKERDKKFYLGYVKFHKNSIYKHFADTREEVERCCKNRISKVVYEKEKASMNIKYEYKDFYVEIQQLFYSTYEGRCTHKYKERPGLIVKGETPEEIEQKLLNYIDSLESLGKTERIKRLENQIATLQQELEKVKSEKETYIYKRVVLEINSIPDREGKVKGTLKKSKYNFWVADNLEELRKLFENYVDELEKSANHYLQLTGQEIT